jgi:hypothetical protein
MQSSSATGGEDRWSRGGVAILDALGVSVFGRHESDAFLNWLEKVKPTLDDFARDRQKLGGDAHVELRIFGGTILGAWPVDDGTPAHEIIEGLAIWASAAIAHGLAAGFRLRGAISFGDYRSTGSAVLGPAFSDAALWHDASEWIGVHITPSAQLVYEGSLLGEDPPQNTSLIPYNVPLHNGETIATRAVRWPAVAMMVSKGDSTNLAMTGVPTIATQLGIHPTPRESDHKIRNTMEFVRWLTSEHGEELRAQSFEESVTDDPWERKIG